MADCTTVHDCTPHNPLFVVEPLCPVHCALSPVSHGLSFALATPTSRYAVCNIPTCPCSHAQSLLVWQRITHLHVVVGWCPHAHRVAVPKASRPSMQCQLQMASPDGPQWADGRHQALLGKGLPVSQELGVPRTAKSNAVSHDDNCCRLRWLHKCIM